MKILAIETSCDETAASVAQDKGEGVEILSNIVSSQIDIHKKYGGVVPELAAREHVLNMVPVVDQALREAGLQRAEIDGIAVTKGPGLMSSLQSGVETAKSLAFAWDKPLIPINHIEGHIYANFIDQEKKVELPAIVLTVSGGHTMLILMKGHGDYVLLGETRDDAAGEAFDKAAKLMGLGYPGGPVISTRAENYKTQITNYDNKIKLPRPMIDSPDYDFSFSGLKTAIRYAIEKDSAWEERIEEYCYEFQEAVVETLVAKTLKAVKEYKAKTLMLAGGVAANKRLRENLESQANEKLKSVDFLKPDLVFTTDNAAMIASAGVFKARRGAYVDWKTIVADCNYDFI